MLEWDEVDPYATWPEERYRAVSGKHEYRIFLDPVVNTSSLSPTRRKSSGGRWWFGRTWRMACGAMSCTVPSARSPR